MATTSSSSSSDSDFVELLEEPVVLPPSKRARKSSKSAPRRTSWTLLHMESLSSGRRRCKYCSSTFSAVTGTGSLATHLSVKHNVKKNQILTKPPVQLSIESTTTLASKRKFDSVVATYIVQGVLSYEHVESGAFKTLISALAPGYDVITKTTVKRRVLAMYIVLKCLVQQYLLTLSVAFSVTFDGWSNQSCRGYYVCTLHWTSIELACLCSCTLDFFYVTPGDGVGVRCGNYLTALFNTFGISGSVLALISDSGSDAVAAASAVVASAAEAQDGERDGLVPVHLRCFAHTFQLAIRCITDAITPPLRSLRSCISLIRSGKQRRSMFRSIAIGLFQKAYSPPCVDTPTRWNSTHDMLKQSISLKGAITAVALADSVYVDCQLGDGDWKTFADVEKFLRVPAKISTLIGAGDSCSISLAHGANASMIRHCNMNVHHGNPIVAAASEAMLANLIDHRMHLSNNVAVVSKFLDLRAARDSRSVDFLADRHIVEKVMDLPRYAQAGHAVVTVHETSDDEDADVDLFGVMDAGSAADHELARYVLQPQLAKDVDVVQWWVMHQAEYPILCKMAMDYLAIPATSVPSERANSAAKRVFDGRETLGDNMFKAEMCCQSWLRLAADVGLVLPVDYLEELERLKRRVDLEEMAKDDIVIQYYLDYK